MSFIIRKEKSSARLIRRREIAHGEGMYKKSDVSIGSLPLSATELPVGFPVGHEPLTPAELDKLERELFAPARKRLAERERAALETQLDPSWRLLSAVRLLREVARLSEQRDISSSNLDELQSVLSSIRRAEFRDPLAKVAAAMESARSAIAAGCYGSRPQKVRMNGTPVAAGWKTLRDGTDELRRELQKGGWVKNRR